MQKNQLRECYGQDVKFDVVQRIQISTWKTNLDFHSRLKYHINIVIKKFAMCKCYRVTQKG